MGLIFSKRVRKLGTRIRSKLTEIGPNWAPSMGLGQRIMEHDRGSEGNAMELVLKPKIEVKI